MSYSKLVSYVKLSPNCTKPRNHKIDKITIHYMAGDALIENVGNWFSQRKAGASSNYGIGSDGRIACYVEEENRSWASSNASNDNRAITIEVANYEDGSISDKAWESLINLCVDICQRYSFELNFTGDKNGNLTMHKWFAPTACPGPWLEPRFPVIAAEVNKRLGVTPVVKESDFAPSMRNLRRGCEGEDVRALQILLSGRGYNGNMYKPDGKFGPNTEGAVKLYQKAKGLAVDGIAGKNTWSALLGV
jgi:N-acetyl-anhydromuramyl-L-alanine amidase AmpD